MPISHLRFHHFGLAVRKPDYARKFIAARGYELGEAFFDPAQNVFLQMCNHPSEPGVEIIWPGATPGPIDKLVQRHTSGIIYHICYETGDLTAALNHWQEAGLTVLPVSSPTPTPIFGGRRVSFYNVVGMGLVEILE